LSYIRFSSDPEVCVGQVFAERKKIAALAAKEFRVFIQVLLSNVLLQLVRIKSLEVTLGTVQICQLLITHLWT